MLAEVPFRGAEALFFDVFGPNAGEMAPTVKVDVAGRDLADLADKLGA